MSVSPVTPPANSRADRVPENGLHCSIDILLPTDVRIVAATNRDLEELKASRFRKDFYFRLNVYDIILPPLRDRPQDIPLLVKHFFKLHGQRTGRYVTSVEPEAWRLLKDYAWLGNVRELDNVISRALIDTNTTTLKAASLPPSLHAHQPEEALLQAIASHLRRKLRAGERGILPRLWADILRTALQIVLDQVHNKTEAAKILGMSRTSLLNELAKMSPHPENSESP